MIGIELNVPYKEIRQRLLFDEHVFTGCAGTNVLRLLPPLCLSMTESDEFIEKFTKTILSPL
jgi:acetylornithine aminotransferase